MGNVSTTRRKSTSKELEKYCRPTGLYETCPWEERVVRRWILEGHVAPRYPGSDAPGVVNVSSGSAIESAAFGSGGTMLYGSSMTLSGAGFSSRGSAGSGHFGHVVGGQLEQQQSRQQQQQQQVYQTEECPICFMHYQGVNRTVCCSKPLCTECYLQVRPPRSSVVCPFCNCSKFSVEYRGPPSKEENERRLAEEQRTIEARIHAEQEEIMRQFEERKQRQSTTSTAAAASGASSGGTAEAAAKSGSGIRLVAASGRLPLATVAERRLTEQQIRNQHISLPTPGTPISTRRRHQYRRGSRSSVRRSSAGESDSGSGSDYQDQHHLSEGLGGLGALGSMGDGHGEGEIQQVEDLMLMEALRLSVLEEQARRERSGDMRRAAAAAAASSTAGSGGTERLGGSETATSASQRSLLSGNFWDGLRPPPSPSSTTAAASVASAAPAAANAAAPAPAPASTSTGESSSSSEPMSIFPGGGLSSWLDMRGIQRESMATGGGGGSSRGEASASSGAAGASGDAAVQPQTVEAVLQSLRAQVGWGGYGEGSSAAASGAAFPEQPQPGGKAPSLLSAAGNTHDGTSQQQQRSTVAAVVAEAARDGGVDGATTAYPGAGQQWRPEVSMRRGTSESASAAGGLDGYLQELPESEDEQLRLAIALSLRSSSSGGGSGGGGSNDSRSATGGVAASAITTGDPLGVSRGSVRNLSLGAGGSASRTLMGSGAAGDSKARARGPGDGDDRLEVKGLCSITAEGKGGPPTAEKGKEKASLSDSWATTSTSAGAGAGVAARSSSTNPRPPPAETLDGKDEVVRKLPAPPSQDDGVGEGTGDGTVDAFEAAVASFSAFAATATERGPFSMSPSAEASAATATQGEATKEDRDEEEEKSDPRGAETMDLMDVSEAARGGRGGSGGKSVGAGVGEAGPSGGPDLSVSISAGGVRDGDDGGPSGALSEPVPGCGDVVPGLSGPAVAEESSQPESSIPAVVTPPSASASTAVDTSGHVMDQATGGGVGGVTGYGGEEKKVQVPEGGGAPVAGGEERVGALSDENPADAPETGAGAARWTETAAEAGRVQIGVGGGNEAEKEETSGSEA